MIASFFGLAVRVPDSWANILSQRQPEPEPEPDTNDIDAHRVLFADDGMDYWRRRMHARCDPRRGIHCPWCDEFHAEKN